MLFTHPKCNGSKLFPNQACHRSFNRQRYGNTDSCGNRHRKAERHGFNLFVKEGDHVKKGDKLLSFDLKYIKENASSDAIPIVFTENPSVKLIKGAKNYKANEDMIEVKKEN